MENLCLDCLTQILSKVPFRDLFQLAKTSKAWFEFFKDDSIWKQMVYLAFELKNPNCSSYMKLYKKLTTQIFIFTELPRYKLRLLKTCLESDRIVQQCEYMNKSVFVDRIKYDTDLNRGILFELDLSGFSKEFKQNFHRLISCERNEKARRMAGFSQNLLYEYERFLIKKPKLIIKRMLENPLETRHYRYTLVEMG